jgi:hypothetical protein
MNAQMSFHIVTAAGLLSRDTFVVAREQPANLKTDCLLVVNQRDRSLRAVHATRLGPVASSRPSPRRCTKIACRTCGHVEGVAEERLSCPYHGHSPCGLQAVRGLRS